MPQLDKNFLFNEGLHSSFLLISFFLLFFIFLAITTFALRAKVIKENKWTKFFLFKWCNNTTAFDVTNFPLIYDLKKNKSFYDFFFCQKKDFFSYLYAIHNNYWALKTQRHKFKKNDA